MALHSLVVGKLSWLKIAKERLAKDPRLRVLWSYVNRLSPLVALLFFYSLFAKSAPWIPTLPLGVTWRLWFKKTRIVDPEGVANNQAANTGGSTGTATKIGTFAKLNANTMTAGGNLTLSHISNNFFKEEQDGSSDHTRSVTKWLSEWSPTFHKTQSEILDTVVEGTGKWLIRDQAFEKWVGMSPGILWGTGILGSGKTCLTAIVVDYLKKHCTDVNEWNQKPSVVIYMYCRLEIEATIIQILGSLLSQLVESSEDAARYVEKHLYEPYKNQGLGITVAPTRTEIMEAINAVVGFYSRIFIVIDALDELEYETHTELIQTLIPLHQWIFVTSRNVFLNSALKVPNFEIRPPDEDLLAFSKRELERHPSLSRGLQHREEIIAEIAQRIIVKSGGIFLLAAQHFCALASKDISSARKRKEVIEQLPDHLDVTYELTRTMERIGRQNTRDRILASHALVWVTHAARPLKVKELTEVLLIDLESRFTSLDQDDCISELTLVSICHGLLTIEKDTGTVQLTHNTAQDFFERFKDPFFEKPHEFLANVCAVYLHLIEADFSKVASDIEIRDLSSSYPFFDYACWNLGHHLRKALGSSSSRRIPKFVAQFFEKNPSLPLRIDGTACLDSGKVSHFAGFHGLPSLLRRHDNLLSLKSALGYTPLFYACLGGNLAIVEHLIDNEIKAKANDPLPFGRVDINISGRLAHGRHALYLASKKGCISVVKQLLGCPFVDVNAIEASDRAQTALHIAAKGGHEEVIRLLLSSPGINMNLPNRDSSTALHIAASKGYKSSVLCLLNAPDEMNADSVSTVLPFEIQTGDPCADADKKSVYMHGHGSAVQLLVSPNIDTNPRTDDGSTPLMLASHTGHEGVVKILLNHPDVDVNAQRKDGASSLYLASRNGHTAVVELLLSKPDIDVNLCDDDNWTPLHIACSNGHETIVPLLLASANLDNSLRTGQGSTPLILASEDGHGGVVRLLLNHPAVDVNAQLNDGTSSLYLASQNGHTAVVELLLTKPDIDVNLFDDDNWTPLHIACSKGYEKVVLLLLASPNLDINPRTSQGSTLLILASEDGHGGVVRLLLNHGAIDINAQMNDGESPLYLASQNGHTTVVDLLLSTPDIDVNLFENGENWTPLHTACVKGHEGVVQLLLNHPAVNVNAQVKDGVSPLYFASENGHTAVVEVLLSKPDIDVNLIKTNTKSISLHPACEDGHEGVARLLLNHPAVDVNAQMKDGESPLFLASENGHDAVVKLLLSRPGVNVNAVESTRSWTALHVACSKGYASIVRRLLRHPGIRIRPISSENPVGLTPLEVAKKKRHSQIAKLFKDIA